jgi:D-sedoheptulose 7-phosphate isomerase
MRAMDMTARMTQHFDDAIAALRDSRESLPACLTKAVDVMHTAIDNKCKILACGNGGSAADAQHFIAELVGRFEHERRPLPGITLSADTSIMTAVGNDYGFDCVFGRQIQALGRAGDVLVCLSTSGESPNVLRAVEVAQACAMTVIALTGKGGGTLGKRMTDKDIHLCVPHDRTMRIQEVHILLLHALCDGLDAHLIGETT